MRAFALAIAIAIALSGCQATQERTESIGAQPVAQAPATATTPQETAQTESTVSAATPPEDAAPAPSGLAALSGHWAGKWGGSPSTLTVTSEPDTVEYCYRTDCWTIEEYTVDDDTLGWRNRGWRFSFTLTGDRVRGKLVNPQGTTRITMKHK